MLLSPAASTDPVAAEGDARVEAPSVNGSGHKLAVHGVARLQQSRRTHAHRHARWDGKAMGQKRRALCEAQLGPLHLGMALAVEVVEPIARRGEGRAIEMRSGVERDDVEGDGPQDAIAAPVSLAGVECRALPLTHHAAHREVTDHVHGPTLLSSE